VFDAVLDVPGGNRTGAPLFDTPASHRTITRISRATGTPKPLPDAFGLAFRVLDRDVDVLLTTSIDAPVLHHLPMPAPRGPWGQSYSSLLAYDVGGRTCLIGALPHADERAFDLVLAPVRGRWEPPIARLRLLEQLPDEAALNLDPWNCGDGVRPTGPLQELRRPAYRGSRRGRGAPP
jgi:hypothetical protein